MKVCISWYKEIPKYKNCLDMDKNKKNMKNFLFSIFYFVLIIKL